MSQFKLSLSNLLLRLQVDFSITNHKLRASQLCLLEDLKVWSQRGSNSTIMRPMSVFLAFFAFLEMAKPASIMSTSDRAVKRTSECQICEYVMKFIRFQTVNQAQSMGALKQKLKALFKLVPPSRQVKKTIFCILTLRRI